MNSVFGTPAVIQHRQPKVGKHRKSQTKPLKTTSKKTLETEEAAFLLILDSTFQLRLLSPPTGKRSFISIHHIEGCQSLSWVYQRCKAVPYSNSFMHFKVL